MGGQTIEKVSLNPYHFPCFASQKAKITQEGSGITNLNMLELIRDPDWTRDVLRKGDVQYEYHMPFRPPLRPRQPGSSILMPTASTRGHAGITLHTSPMPVTFMGTQSSVVRFDTWDFSVFHSFEIEFRTFEPNGVLFFVWVYHLAFIWLCILIPPVRLVFCPPWIINPSVSLHCLFIQLPRLALVQDTESPSTCHWKKNCQIADIVDNCHQSAITHQSFIVQVLWHLLKESWRRMSLNCRMTGHRLNYLAADLGTKEAVVSHASPLHPLQLVQKRELNFGG